MIIEFTTEESDTLVLGWHEALLGSRLPESPIEQGAIVRLDLLTQKADGVLDEVVVESIMTLEAMLALFEPYYLQPLREDDQEMNDVIYPINQKHNEIRRRFRNATALLKSKLGVRET